ncbi:hypothetical protein SAMN04490247_0624 [Salimicrobium halophilum]|uniref:Uncharacterized protein n=1 Tax=Salimicrobium halophilum TaxID=86666 RepID=A0A1G8QH86_9BACI|nr:hypothetical protein SAMN04490247_0624 [Salimicrobium halophilum]
MAELKPICKMLATNRWGCMFQAMRPIMLEIY